MPVDKFKAKEKSNAERINADIRFGEKHAFRLAESLCEDSGATDIPKPLSVAARSDSIIHLEIANHLIAIDRIVRDVSRVSFFIEGESEYTADTMARLVKCINRAITAARTEAVSAHARIEQIKRAILYSVGVLFVTVGTDYAGFISKENTDQITKWWVDLGETERNAVANDVRTFACVAEIHCAVQSLRFVQLPTYAPTFNVLAATASTSGYTYQQLRSFVGNQASKWFYISEIASQRPIAYIATALSCNNTEFAVFATESGTSTPISTEIRFDSNDTPFELFAVVYSCLLILKRGSNYFIFHPLFPSTPGKVVDIATWDASSARIIVYRPRA
jgi:hypothetical protein